MPKWDEYTLGFPLAAGDVTLRDEKWVPITPKRPDVDAISSKSFVAAKSATATPQFRNTKKGVFHLEISPVLHDRMIEAKEMREEEEEGGTGPLLHPGPQSNDNYSEPRPAAPKGKSTRKASTKSKKNKTTVVESKTEADSDSDENAGENIVQPERSPVSPMGIYLLPNAGKGMWWWHPGRNDA
ncbi:hypothetical protein R3P38DRAFT_2808828 [Favolaschia claudopus]|uniref:Uncharacterized protein n=1 Tax=Favolaschia claudopus TaxID=2862362 RepID=A0AAV9ZF89_9AGAR